MWSSRVLVKSCGGGGGGAITLARQASSSSSSSWRYASPSQSGGPEKPKEAAVEIYERQQAESSPSPSATAASLSPSQKLLEDQYTKQLATPVHQLYPASLFDETLAPTAKPNTGLPQPLPFPLKWPEYDQSIPPAQRFPHLVNTVSQSSPPNWWQADFDDRASAPIGDYPRHVPLQWAQLKDPFAYWDQQGRREYGEILYDHDNYADWLGIGPEVHWWSPFKSMMQVFAAIGVMGVGIAWWNPENHRWFAEKDYPYNGLRVELGGDPADEGDNWSAAPVYKSPN